MNFRQGYRYVNIQKKAEETVETREETRTRKRKEKNCELVTFGGTPTELDS